MTKNEYIKRLEEALSACDSELRTEILEGYEEHFKNGLLEGKTEEEICTELGDVEEFINEIPAEYNVLPAKTTTIPSDQSDHDYEHEFPNNYSADGINSVIIESKPSSGSSADITITKSNNHTIGIDGPTYEDSGFKCLVTLENNTCYIRISNDRPIVTSILHKIFKHSEADFHISIPEAIKTVKAGSTCGDMDIQNCNVDDFNITLSCGDFNINNCVAATAAFTSYNGDGDINNCEFTNIKFVTSNGDIDSQNLKSDIASFTTSNGDIDFENVISNDLHARSSKGDVTISGSITKITATSSMGDVDVTNFSDCCVSCDIRSSMGDIDYTCENNNGFVASCKTSMGDVDVTYNGQNIKKGADKLYHAGYEVTKINMSTSMGDICLKG